MKMLLPLITLALSLSAVAGGDKVGNGGDVIQCPGEKTILLDIFQGRESWGFEIQLKESNRIQTLNETMKTFTGVDRTIAQKLLSRALEIEKELSSLERGESSTLVKLTKNTLVNISDEGVAELPAGCAVVQAATQIQDPLPGEVKFTFQKKIWSELDSSAQATLIMHEVIYEHMISVRENSSRSTRYFNAALFAGALNSVKNYFEISAIFDFRNLAIDMTTKERIFGEKGECRVKREKFRMNNSSQVEGTTIIVGSKNIVTKKENFDEAISLFREKYTSNGFCD